MTAVAGLEARPDQRTQQLSTVGCVGLLEIALQVAFGFVAAVQSRRSPNPLAFARH
ncbi:hypothetical protein [Escherichia coli]|uniref:hypothetical protein n=1 Tax=Escherichia coli TaxID=562 RepID=UPI00137A9849